MRSNTISVTDTTYATEISPSRKLMKRLYSKIEDLKIIEDILAQPDAQHASSSPLALKVIRRLQQDISTLSQQLVGEATIDDNIQ